MAALAAKNGDSESKLYENIVNIPHYHNKWLTILDKENETEVVQENFAKYQQIYQPVWKDAFKECMEITADGKIHID